MAICYQNAIFGVQTITIIGELYPEKIDASIIQKDRDITIGKFGVNKGYSVTREQKTLDFLKTPH